VAISLSTPPDQCEISLRKSLAHRPDTPAGIDSNPRQKRGKQSKATAGKKLHNGTKPDRSR
jgi:hypothetical protein